MTRASVALLLWVALAGPAVPADPDPTSLAVPAATAARATALVAALASRDYQERDDATRELRRLGRLAYPALRDALRTNSNQEVRFRVEMVLPAARLADLEARLECLLADTDGKYRHDHLPGGRAFLAAVGRTEAGRNLFAAMLRSDNRPLLLAADDPEPDLRRKFDDRRDALGLIPGRYSYVEITDEDVASILLVESVLPDSGVVGGGFAPPVGRIGRFGGTTASNNAFLSTLGAALSDDKRREAMGGVVRRWMETRDHPQSVSVAVGAMDRHGLADALPAARNLIAGKVAGGPISFRAQALAYLARFGTADDLPAFEKLFGDKVTLTVGVPNGPISRRYTIQLRDVALAMALLLNGEDPTNYGFDFRYVRGGSDSQKHNPQAYYFDAESEERQDELRLAAFVKYADWKAKKAKEKGKK